ncbi:MAG: hypothetical protein JWN70_4666 [Planctomycetaceae bacterium]|nr:hypothetical protein [Planctomycetaceae bacterium]
MHNDRLRRGEFTCPGQFAKGVNRDNSVRAVESRYAVEGAS